MKRKEMTGRRGFTLTELATTIAIAGIMMLAMGVVLVDSQRGWQQTFDRVFSDVVTDGYVARKTFDSIVRRSSYRRESIGSGWIEVYYYSDPDTSTRLDRYARFYQTGNELRVMYGPIDVNGNLQGQDRDVMIARNVQSVTFSIMGSAVQMVLGLDNGEQQITVMTSAVRHNE
jgi:prepilin-type N-terminal cleavage/methylation domain-containing protein